MPSLLPPLPVPPGLSAALLAPALEPERWLSVLGRAHLLLVHFPIALLWMAALAELVHRLRSREGRSPTAFACLGVGALSAVVAGSTGWLYADLEPLGSSVQDTLFRHRWLGVAGASGAVLAFACACFAAKGGLAGRLHRGLLVLTLVLVTAGAHFGGTLVHGSDYLFGSPTASGSAPVADASSGLPAPVRADSVTPTGVDRRAAVRRLFARRCADCHGPRKQKGELRLDDLSSHFARARSDWVIVPGDAAGSELVRRLTLPAEHEDAMPPKGERLTREQLMLVQRWIDEGAEWSPPSPRGAGEAPLRSK